MRRFGSVKRLRKASVEEIAEVPGVGPHTAQALYDALVAASPAAPAVDPATGEIVSDEVGESRDTTPVSVAGSGSAS
jgi:excinuclease ABC subunit C